MRGRVADPAGAAAGFGEPRGGEVPPTRRLTPLRIAALYAVLGATWILFSDRLLASLVQDATLQRDLQTVKGWFFVLATAGLIHLLATRLVAELRQRDERVRATVESMPDAVLVVDAGARVVEVNPAAVELLGASGEGELLGPLAALAERFQLRRPDGSPFPPGGFASLRALRGETLRGYEAIFRRPDGRDVYVGVTASPVRDRAGERPRLAVAVVRDMSELRRFE